METIAIVLTVGKDSMEAFESGFRDEEYPVWQDLFLRGLLVGASLTRMEISTGSVDGATQYLVVAVFATGEGHHEHDNHPAFQAWNKRADAFQVAPAMAFGGETILELTG